MKKGKTLLLIGGFLLISFGAASILGGAAILYFNQRTDKDGFALSDAYKVRSTACAFALWVKPIDWNNQFFILPLKWFNHEDFVQTKWVVRAVNSSKELFVGWANATDGESYLERNTIAFETPSTDWYWDTQPYYAGIEIYSTAIYNNGTPSRSPIEETFWLKSAHSSNSSTINWDPVWEPPTSKNILIVMNLDGSRNVDADIQLGFKVPIFSWLPYLLIPLGALLSVSGFFLIRRRADGGKRSSKIIPSAPGCG
jgi:hypothetical protein